MREEKRFYEEVNAVPAYARIHKILARDLHSQVGTLVRPDGTYTTEGQETSGLLLDTHFPGCVKSTHGTSMRHGINLLVRIGSSLNTLSRKISLGTRFIGFRHLSH